MAIRLPECIVKGGNNHNLLWNIDFSISLDSFDRVITKGDGKPSGRTCFIRGYSAAFHPQKERLVSLPEICQAETFWVSLSMGGLCRLFLLCRICMLK